MQSPHAPSRAPLSLNPKPESDSCFATLPLSRSPAPCAMSKSYDFKYKPKLNPNPYPSHTKPVAGGMKAKFPLFKTFYLGVLAGCYIAFGTHSSKYSRFKPCLNPEP